MFSLPREAGSRALVRLVGLFRKERGQTLAEYSLILGVLAVAVMVPAGILFRNAISGAFIAASSCLNGSC